MIMSLCQDLREVVLINNNKELVIIGASGLGKEVAWLAKRLQIKVKGFLDDNPLTAHFYNLPILGPIHTWPEHDDVQFIIAVASPRVRLKIYMQHFVGKKVDFATLIDPSVQWLSEDLSIGEGSVICAGSITTANVQIGNHVIVNKLVSIGHDVNIADFVTISPQVMLGGNTNVLSGAEVGAGSKIRQGLTIGTGASLGMGSILTKNTQPNTLYFGNPAKVIKQLEAF